MKPKKPEKKTVREILNSVYQDGNVSGDFDPVIANGTIDIALREIEEYYKASELSVDEISQLIEKYSYDYLRAGNYAINKYTLAQAITNAQEERRK